MFLQQDDIWAESVDGQTTQAPSGLDHLLFFGYWSETAQASAGCGGDSPMPDITFPLPKSFTGIMSQDNSVHQHGDQSTAHTCFLTQGWAARPLLCCFLLLLIIPTVAAHLTEYLQLSESQHTQWLETFSITGCQNLRHQLPSALGAATCQILSWEKILEYYLCLLQPTACLFWVTLKSVAARWQHPNPRTGRAEYCLGLQKVTNVGGGKERKCALT